MEILKENQYKDYKRLYFKKEKFELEEHYNQLKSIERREINESSEPTPRVFTYDTGSNPESPNDDSGTSEIKNYTTDIKSDSLFQKILNVAVGNSNQTTDSMLNLQKKLPIFKKGRRIGK